MKFPTRQRAIVAVIRSAREAAGLSQRQLSTKLGEPPNWIQRIETLERRLDVAEFMAIAKAVNADAVDLFRQAMR
jgi:transcriptional regulator with XRE-family HTH domain